MNRDGERSAKAAQRNQKQPRTQQNKRRDNKEAQAYSSQKDTETEQCDPPREVRAAALQAKRAGKQPSGAGAECQRSPRAQRKLSDASNASEDLSKDSGCPSGKLSCSDSSSEISDCPSDGTKHDSPSGESDLSWIDGKADLSRDGEDAGDRDAPRVKGAGGGTAPQLDAAVAGFSLFSSSGTLLDLMMGNTTEDLVREVEDLRSENEYLKDEVEELRCEMLEMRDMFQEEEVYQLQELRLQLEQANKTCRILHYRLRKAERRSIRVAQTGQVDGELVKSLEHDIKVAKSVSRRLYTELEVVQKKNSQLEWDNEVLRENTQELEVCKQVLQAELEKARESSQKKRGVRSAGSKAEKRLSQQIEDDSADLKCQLHFAKEELALMCKKLTKLVSESETMREDLAKYHAAFGDVDAAQSPEGKQNSARGREAEVKAHLKLVEEEATLLSRRIVELEVENRGLRAEMSDLREKVGGGGGGGEEEEEESREVSDENQAATDNRERVPKVGATTCEQGQNEGSDKRSLDVEGVCSRSQQDVVVRACHIPREGPIGGERDPSDTRDSNDGKNPNRSLKGMSLKDLEALLALRDHSCVLSSAVQILTAPTKNGHSSPPTGSFTSPTDMNSMGKAQKVFLSEALELLQAMLSAFISRVETLLALEDSGKASAGDEGRANHNAHNVRESRLEGAVERRGTEEKRKTKETRAMPDDQRDFLSTCRDPKMQLSLQILWILHQWCQVNRADMEGKEVKRDVSVLRGLLRDLGEELQDEQTECDSEARAAAGEAAERAAASALHDGRPCVSGRICGSTGSRARRQFSPHGAKRSKNWCYLSQEAAQLDREDPVKTWDHLIMPLSFPELNFEQMSMERSHTAPEKSVFRIYYSPPSARRVQLAQQMQSPVSDGGSISTHSPWCTPPTSFSQLCLGSPANLSDDMKEMTAGWRQRSHGGPQEKRGRLAERWVDVACSGTQTLVRPQMVSVGQQTDGTLGSMARSSPSRVVSPSLISARAHHISSSLDGIAGRAERPRSSTSSPKLYRRHSATAVSSIPSPANLSSSSSSSTSRERAMWNVSHKSHPGLVLSRQSSPRAGATQSHSPLTGNKPPSKMAAANRYGLVTEFLRRVSGRADKPAPSGQEQKTKTPKNLERVPTRPASAPPHRNDSVTRIVNQRFMKQREEASRGPKEEKGSLNPSGRHSMSTTTPEDGNYECSSSRTLTFCFARPSRSTRGQASNPSRLQRHRHPPAASAAADSSCG